MIKKYIRNILISIDQFVNTIFLGDPDETISSRLGKHYRESWMERIVDWMFQWQHKPDGHCENSEEKDEGSDAITKLK